MMKIQFYLSCDQKSKVIPENDFDICYDFAMSHSKEDDLKLGSITEVWTSREQWLKYCQYLDNMAAEAYDSEGVPIKLSRYALFLKVCN